MRKKKSVRIKGSAVARIDVHILGTPPHGFDTISGHTHVFSEQQVVEKIKVTLKQGNPAQPLHVELN